MGRAGGSAGGVNQLPRGRGDSYMRDASAPKRLPMASLCGQPLSIERTIPHVARGSAGNAAADVGVLARCSMLYCVATGGTASCNMLCELPGTVGHAVDAGYTSTAYESRTCRRAVQNPSFRKRLLQRLDRRSHLLVSARVACTRADARLRQTCPVEARDESGFESVRGAALVGRYGSVHLCGLGRIARHAVLGFMALVEADDARELIAAQRTNRMHRRQPRPSSVRHKPPQAAAAAARGMDGKWLPIGLDMYANRA